METLVVLLIIGVIVSYLLGRWRAENGRARADQRNVWKNRKNYRG